MELRLSKVARAARFRFSLPAWPHCHADPSWPGDGPQSGPICGGWNGGLALAKGLKADAMMIGGLLPTRQRGEYFAEPMGGVGTGAVATPGLPRTLPDATSRPRCGQSPLSVRGSGSPKILPGRCETGSEHPLRSARGFSRHLD